MHPQSLLCVTVFLLALCLNLTFASTLGTRSRAASRQAVKNGGLNPTLWAFSLWGVLYMAFTLGYVMSYSVDTQPLPWALSCAWIANIIWVLASCANQWTIALGVIVLYLAATLASLRNLQALPGYDFQAKEGICILNIATASLAVWLVAAMLLNVQIVVPIYARAAKVAALPIIISVAIFLAFKSGDLSDCPGWMSLAVACTAIWICLALEENPHMSRLGHKDYK